MFKPAGDRLLVEVQKQEEKTKSGLYVSSAASEAEVRAAIVMGIGPGKWNMREECYEGIDFEIGDKILINRYGGTRCSNENENLLIIKEEEVLGILKEKE